MSDTAFGEQIKAWREALGLSQQAVDEAIGKTRGFVGQIETGRLKPPEQDLCEALGRALKRQPGEVWNLAARPRMEAFDPDLWTWHRQQVDAAREAPLSELEERLVSLVRAAQDQIPKRPDGTPIGTVVWPLVEILEGLFADLEPAAEYEAQRAVPPAMQASATLGLMSTLPARTQHQMWKAWAEVARVAGYRSAQ